MAHLLLIDDDAQTDGVVKALTQRGHEVRWARTMADGLRQFRADRADVVLSTVDTVGIPLMLAKRRRVVRPPLVYVAIGLPERLGRLGSERMRRLYARALAASSAVLASGRGKQRRNEVGASMSTERHLADSLALKIGTSRHGISGPVCAT